MATYRCAICEKEIGCEGELPELYPFCSSRCRMVDLGLWLREAYSIDRDLGPEDLPHDRSLRADAGFDRTT
jgi:endogenous inhibitor of DNA gyrase (YacG/DUF329 family)